MYRIIPDAAVSEQLVALPDDALAAYADVLGALEVAPWNGSPQHEANPDGAVRRWPFGPGQAGQTVYLILEEQ
ncbi:MAG TPA: hypothetical protein VN327_14450 [Pseudonocardiaceae bacterium]|jgi:hypothetical protein|nr:hypothetical protein [Pseudonocardiaceae bacterium]